MKFLSVTNKKTHLHKSPADLSIIATYEHDLKGTVSTDISLLGNSFENSFVQIYKTNILEVLRLKKTENGAGKILRSQTSANSLKPSY